MELYKGTKFKTIFEFSSSIEDIKLDELRFWCKEFNKYNLTPQYESGSAGNLNYRPYRSPSPLACLCTQI